MKGNGSLDRFLRLLPSHARMDDVDLKSVFVDVFQTVFQAGKPYGLEEMIGSSDQFDLSVNTLYQRTIPFIFRGRRTERGRAGQG